MHDGARRQYARVHIYGSNLSLRLPPYYLLGPAVSHTHCITVVQCFSLRGKTPVDGREGEEMFYTRRRGGFCMELRYHGFLVHNRHIEAAIHKIPRLGFTQGGTWQE